MVLCCMCKATGANLLPLERGHCRVTPVAALIEDDVDATTPSEADYATVIAKIYADRRHGEVSSPAPQKFVGSVHNKQQAQHKSSANVDFDGSQEQRFQL
jgi:hypothetical protein